MRIYTKPCSGPGPCSNGARAHGLCSSHLDQLTRGAPLAPIRTPHQGCDFPGCDKRHCANGLCKGHRLQQRRGEQLQPLKRQVKHRFLDEKGYVWVYDPGHPNAKRQKGGRNGYVQEHTKVLSQMLGRPLWPGETAHHKNLVRHDNRPENLELWTSHQPRGARVADMVAWCRWFLAQYGDAFPE